VRSVACAPLLSSSLYTSMNAGAFVLRDESRRTEQRAAHGSQNSSVAAAYGLCAADAAQVRAECATDLYANDLPHSWMTTKMRSYLANVTPSAHVQNNVA